MRLLLTRYIQAGVVLFAVCALLPAQVQAASTRTLLLRYHWVIGTSTRQAATDTTTQSGKLTPAMGPPGPATAVQHVTTTQTVRKVYPDGSGQVRFTFTNVSFAQNGKKTLFHLKGYAIDERISPRGMVLSQQIEGTMPMTITAVGTTILPSEVTQQIPTPYPAAAVTVGTVWHQMASVGTFPTYPVVKYIATYQVLALGSSQGQPTVTIRETVDQQFHQTGVVGTLHGRFTGSGTETVLVATFAPVTPAHATFSIPITFTSGIAVGTVTTVIHDLITPLP